MDLHPSKLRWTKSSSTMRLTAVFPLLCTLVAFVLSLLCIFAGSKRGYLEQADILTVSQGSVGLFYDRWIRMCLRPLKLNVSRLGQITPNTSSSSNPSLLDSFEDAATNEINDVTSSLFEKLDIHDFYSAHLLDYCEVNFLPCPCDVRQK